MVATFTAMLMLSRNGTNSTEVNTGLPDTTKVDALASSGTNLFASTDKGFFRRPLSEMVTSVERLSTDLPTQFSLDQNYPNPFNPSTTISYSLPKAAVVTLGIFNALSQEVALLVNERKEAGYYQVRWDGLSVPSGIYFYRLQAGEYLETMKMVVLK